MEQIPKTLFILCGEAFSGKSTLSKEIARHYGAEVMGRDRIYFALEEMLALEDTPEDDDDKLWTNDLWPIAVQGAKNHLLLGKSVVFDDVCLQRWRRDELRTVATAAGARSVLIFLDVPAEVLKTRKDKNKETKERHEVPSSWLEKGAQELERPTEEEHPFIYGADADVDAWFKKLTDAVLAT